MIPSYIHRSPRLTLLFSTPTEIWVWFSGLCLLNLHAVCLTHKDLSIMYQRIECAIYPSMSTRFACRHCELVSRALVISASGMIGSSSAIPDGLFSIRLGHCLYPQSSPETLNFSPSQDYDLFQVPRVWPEGWELTTPHPWGPDFSFICQATMDVA